MQIHEYMYTLYYCKLLQETRQEERHQANFWENIKTETTFLSRKATVAYSVATCCSALHSCCARRHVVCWLSCTQHHAQSRSHRDDKVGAWSYHIILNASHARTHDSPILVWKSTANNWSTATLQMPRGRDRIRVLASTLSPVFHLVCFRAERNTIQSETSGGWLIPAPASKLDCESLRPKEYGIGTRGRPSFVFMCV